MEALARLGRGRVNGAVSLSAGQPLTSGLDNSSGVLCVGTTDDGRWIIERVVRGLDRPASLGSVLGPAGQCQYLEHHPHKHRICCAPSFVYSWSTRGRPLSFVHGFLMRTNCPQNTARIHEGMDLIREFMVHSRTASPTTPVRQHPPHKHQTRPALFVYS